jgi:hypothetical protein
MMRYNDPRKKIKWLKLLKLEINTIIDSSTLNNNEQAILNDVVVLAAEAKDNNLKSRPKKDEGPYNRGSTITIRIIVNAKATHGRYIRTQGKNIPT